MSQKSYRREFFAQVSQIVFFADLTVLGLFTTTWGKISQNSFFHEFCAQVSHIVFIADLIVLRLFTTVWAEMSQNSYHPRVLCTSITNRVPSWFDRFTVLLELYEQKYQETHISTSSVHKYQRSCFKLIWPFYRLLKLYHKKCHKTHISASSVHKYHKSCS